MPNKQLQDYVNQALQAGKAYEQIRQELLNSGWSSDDISIALKSLKFPLGSMGILEIKIAKIITIVLTCLGVLYFSYYFIGLIVQMGHWNWSFVKTDTIVQASTRDNILIFVSIILSGILALFLEWKYKNKIGFSAPFFLAALILVSYLISIYSNLTDPYYDNLIDFPSYGLVILGGIAVLCSLVSFYILGLKNGNNKILGMINKYIALAFVLLLWFVFILSLSSHCSGEECLGNFFGIFYSLIVSIPLTIVWIIFEVRQVRNSLQSKLERLVLFVSVLGIIGYFGSAYSLSLWPFEISSPPIPTYTPRLVPIPTDTEISAWKTYANPELEFKYPESWNFDTFDEIKLGGPIQLTTLPRSAYGEGGVVPPGGAEIIISDTNESLNQVLADDALGAEVIGKELPYAAGQSATRYTYKSSLSSSLFLKEVITYLSYKSKIYKVGLVYHESDPHEPYFLFTYIQILSTFKFLNQ